MTPSTAATGAAGEFCSACGNGDIVSLVKDIRVVFIVDVVGGGIVDAR